MFATSKRSRVLANCILLLGVLWVVVPLYWLVITSLKTYPESAASPPTLFPRQITTTGFVQAWELGGGQGLRDSGIISLSTLGISLALGVPAAYSLSRYRTGGPNFAFAILGVRFMPPVIMAVAFYILGVTTGLLDTHVLLVLVNSLFNLPFVVWIMKGFVDEVPYAIEEAAQMDGATWWQGLRHHVLPLMVPGLVAVSLFVLVFTWNEFILASQLTAAKILPYTRVLVGLNIGQIGACETEFCVLTPNWPAVAALGLMTLAPIVLLAFYLQKYLVRAVTYGGLRE